VAPIDDVLSAHAGRRHHALVCAARDGAHADVRCLGEVRPGGGPPDERTLFEIGSITKVFTATVLADMALEGVVALDQPVQELLPAGVTLPVEGRPITLADLASHVAGLPRLPRGMLVRGLLQREDPWHGFGEEELLASLPRTRVREPGGRVRYSNLGAGLLGLLLARRAGTTYDDLVETRVSRPLGLCDTRTAVPAEDLARFAEGHDRRGREAPHWHITGLPGAGALRSTLADMRTFLDCQLAPPEGRLGDAIRLTQELRASSSRMRVGLGWLALRGRDEGQTLLFHNGGTGGFRSCIALAPGRSRGAVVLSASRRSVDRVCFALVPAA
jgi:CubicO group peptidase (beta-lactamase class C family)